MFLHVYSASGGQGVAGSNPVAPTIFFNPENTMFSGFLFTPPLKHMVLKSIFAKLEPSAETYTKCLRNAKARKRQTVHRKPFHTRGGGADPAGGQKGWNPAGSCSRRVLHGPAQGSRLRDALAIVKRTGITLRVPRPPCAWRELTDRGGIRMSQRNPGT